MAYTISDFYVGQLVRIREWENMKEEFGETESGDINNHEYYYFRKQYNKYCGMEGAIKEISDDGFITLESDETPIALLASELEPVEECQTVPFDEELFYQMVIGKRDN